LKELGHEVSGYSLEPIKGGLFDRAGLHNMLKGHFIGDIRNLSELKSAFFESDAQFAIHLAAQPLVLDSYLDPIETYTTNVDGTRNFLEVITMHPDPPVSLVVTTDKVYRDEGKSAYVETDPIGGHDPYSASKAMADIMTQSWASTHPLLKLHIARAGNVIGAFDTSPNRLVPDALRAFESGGELLIRNPNSVRPWQHILDCLAGYLAFVEAAAQGNSLPVALNFGPDPASIRTVSDLVSTLGGFIPGLQHRVEVAQNDPKESALLSLDSSLSRNLLGWENAFSFEEAVLLSVLDYDSDDPLTVTQRQVRDFVLSKGLK
jgi:CDP-glucose 4,6-dehydratase